MENLKGIRKLYRKGNGQGTEFRGRMNSWSYYELQRQVEYKANWEGIPVFYVDAWGTSKRCSICGSKLIPEENRLLKCPTHGIVDRDVNAARNIVARGMKFVPFGFACEAMVKESGQVILKVDANQITSKR
jgi:transposase